MSAGSLEPGQSDPSAGAETEAIHYTPPDASAASTSANSSNTPPATAKRRRITVLSGAAVLAVGAVAGVLAISGGSGSHPAAASRQDAQISEGGPGNGDQPGGAAGQSTSEQGGGGPANGQSATPSALGSTGAPTSQQPGSSTGPSTNPAQPNGSSSLGNPSRTPAPIASTTNGNQPTTPPPGTKPPAYAGRLASGAAQSSSASTSVTLQTTGASSDNDALLLSLMLTNTHTGAVGASDSAGNSYAVIADQSDGAGDRTLILAALHAKPLGAGGSVTVTFPATREHHVALDDFSGVTAISGHSSATAASGPFASGSVPAPGGGTGIVFAAAGIQGGENATWSGGFTGLPTVLVAPADQLATAYESGGAGSAQASGSCDHQWMAAVVTLSR